MKRLNNLYQRIYSLENLHKADAIAQKGKSKQKGVLQHKEKCEENIYLLYETLKDNKFNTSPYTTFKIYEPKEREVFRLPYYPDRIVQHAIMNVLEPIFLSVFTSDIYNCIKGRGLHTAANKLKKALKNKSETSYCLKLDIEKFYPSVNNQILKQLLRKKFKDQALLQLLDNIIDSAPGLPIGSYLSQYFANFYLTYFDHWIKEDLKIKYYFRYADDIVILGSDKVYLHGLLAKIKEYLKTQLSLTVKSNYQVFPIESRGIDFLGYRFFHTHTLLRKRIKKNFARSISKGHNPQSVASYRGWAKHCNSTNLLKKLTNK